MGVWLHLRCINSTTGQPPGRQHTDSVCNMGSCTSFDRVFIHTSPNTSPPLSYRLHDLQKVIDALLGYHTIVRDAVCVATAKSSAAVSQNCCHVCHRVLCVRVRLRWR